MSEATQDGISLGKYLSALRDTAGLTQAELAKKVTVSPARISRIESGDISLTDDEIDQMLAAIGTDDAKALREYLDQDWNQLERPPFDHPNLEALWIANGALQKLTALKADPELKSVFVRHVEMYENEVISLARELRSVEHSIAFAGSIGVGKSTAICTTSDLRIATDGPMNKQMVLEAGAGGTTICEVHVKSGPQFGLIIEPRSDDAIKYDVTDFAEYILRLAKAGGASDGEAEEGPGITKEINRAIRNMTGLAETKTKDPATGRQLRNDPAREFAKKYSDVKELAVQILLRMDLPRRDQRDIWYSEGSKLSPLAWLQETFTKVNNGRHEQFSLPQRIEVVIPRPVLNDKKLNIRIVDTKGIDGAATREDLDRLFDDARTFVVLCSKFNDAPENALQQLLQRVKDAGAREIALKTAILVLPRPEEAAAVKDNSGNLVEDEQEGYELKRADVEMHLSRLGLGAVPVEFFNARYDDLLPLREFFVRRVRGIRAVWDARVRAVSNTVDLLIVNHKKEQTTVVYREVMKRLNTWLSKNREIGAIAEQAQQELIRAIQIAHWRSVWASVKRKGDWYNLDYYYQIGYGARTIAAKYASKKTADFEVIINNLIDDPDLSPAHDMLEQITRMLRSKSDEMLKKIEMVGKDAFQETLKSDSDFWNDLETESGSGYRDSIAGISDRWFKAAGRAELHAFLKEKIIESWNEIVAALDEQVGKVAEGD